MAAAAVVSSPSWRPTARPSARTRGARSAWSRCWPAGWRNAIGKASAAAASTQLAQPEQELLSAVQALGYPAAIFPGDEPSRRTIDGSIAALEAASPTPSPLRQPERGDTPSPLLLGEWELVYASSGTYLTRSGGAQALLAASALPGVGVSGIRQGLQLANGSSAGEASSSSGSGGGSSSQPQLRTSNAATLGLGPLGDWEIVVEGVWAVRDGQLARVTFDGFSLQLVGLFDAIKLPRMAKVSIPIQNGRSADFSTTYLSEGLRVARGSTGNLFLFRRAQPAAGAARPAASRSM
ncbi:PAP fibrillin [Chlorella sorokiniana]|uniref:PAP fibrillin n=1 Tax=Chlorella sorokiniana TaxID=3076 RepID=A0A2P6U1P4_CHLSO|nr:PAP fibrillin [Chlorella sorokiniana]|eukprot:PRW60232.1 PAP fibrillin [Chlorella sorokiniana]